MLILIGILPFILRSFYPDNPISIFWVFKLVAGVIGLGITLIFLNAAIKSKRANEKPSSRRSSRPQQGLKNYSKNFHGEVIESMNYIIKSMLIALVLSLIFIAVGGAMIWMWFEGVLGINPMLDLLGFGALFTFAGLSLFILSPLKLIVKFISFKRSIKSVDESWLVGVAKISNETSHILEIGGDSIHSRKMRGHWARSGQMYRTLEYEYIFFDDTGKKRNANSFIKENKLFDIGIKRLIAKYNFTYTDEDLKKFITGHGHNPEEELNKDRKFWTSEYVKDNFLDKIDDEILPTRGDDLKIVFNKNKSFVIEPIL